MGSIASAVGGVVGSIGGMISGNKAANAANQQADYLRNLSAEQQQSLAAQQQRLIDASTTASQMGQFNPVTVTSRFGTPTYTYDSTGRLTSVNANPSNWLSDITTGQQSFIPKYLDLTGAALNTAPQYAKGAQQAVAGGQRMYSLANEALPTSYDVTGKTQEYYDRMQQMVAADRERQLAGTRQGLFNTGRAGLAIGATQAGGELATNPEMAAYYNAIARQDLELANQAEQRARANLQEDISTAGRLFGGGALGYTTAGDLQTQMYKNVAASQAPFTTGMQAVTGLEDTAYSPVARGFSYAAPVTQGQQYAGNMLYQGASGAANVATQSAQLAAQLAQPIANYQYQNSSYSPWGTLLQGMGGSLGQSNLGSWSSLFGNSGGGTGWATSGRTGPVNPATDAGMANFFG